MQYLFHLACMITLFAFPVSCINLENLASLKTLRKLLTGGRADTQELTSSLQLLQQRNCSDMIRQSTRPHQSCYRLKREWIKKWLGLVPWSGFSGSLRDGNTSNSWVGGSITCWGCEQRQSHVRHLAAKKNFYATEEEETTSKSLLKGLTKRLNLQ